MKEKQNSFDSVVSKLLGSDNKQAAFTREELDIFSTVLTEGDRELLNLYIKLSDYLDMIEKEYPHLLGYPKFSKAVNKFNKDIKNLRNRMGSLMEPWRRLMEEIENEEKE